MFNCLKEMTAESNGSQGSGIDVPIVSIRNLDYSFGEGDLKRKVLSDINLDFHGGEIAILTGPSGSGKSTLLTLIGGLRTFEKGSLNVLGAELANSTPAEIVSVRRKIGFIFQQHNLLDFLTVRQNVLMSLQLSSDFKLNSANDRVETILARIGLEEHLHKYPDQLSGGQKQRVAVARALAPAPKLVLADEPTASLDKKSGRDVVELMRSLAREQGCTIILVTHDNRILDVADRIVKIEDGKLLD